jgi:hypothetical protein
MKSEGGIPLRSRRSLFTGVVFTLAVLAPAGVRAAVVVDAVASGVQEPTNVVHAGDGSGRTFVTEKSGRILVYHGWTSGSVFLDLREPDGPLRADGERGLLGLVFHPQYESNGFFYALYTAKPAGDIVLARYHVSADPDVADPASGTVLLQFAHPAASHNGGRIEFGPDGYLYISSGDGVDGNKAQDLTSLLGKMLRIDVDSAVPYAIPPDNPFVGQPPKRDEIWASGLRNPWRFSIDQTTGDVFIADVGQSSREEVDFQPAGIGGRNYGWPIMEGTLCPSGDSRCTDGTFTLPILEYDHSQGGCLSITGGPRVRGPNHPILSAKYLFADFCTGQMWAATEGAGGAWTSALIWEFDTTISTFGEDEAGEIYVAAYSAGVIYRVRDVQPVVSIADAAVKEGDAGSTPAAFQVTLSVATTDTVSVPYSTMPGSAGPADFMAASGTLTFPPGATTASISVLVLGDTLDEPNEAFVVSLGTPSNATLARDRAQGTILDDDGRAALCLPIELLPVTITAQGRYCLTHNLSTAQANGAAITIASDFVVLDFGGFKIGGGGAGPGTQATGVYALDRKNVTIENGNIRGFFRGIFLEDSSGSLDVSQGHLVQAIRADENTYAGIEVQGRGNVVRNNQVVSTTGTTVFGGSSGTYGIRSFGSGARILNNDVTDTVPVGSGSGFAIEVEQASGGVIEKNRVGNASLGDTYGIKATSGGDVLVVSNRVALMGFGLFYDAATGKYRRNLTAGVGVPYTGGTDAGRNN